LKRFSKSKWTSLCTEYGAGSEETADGQCTPSLLAAATDGGAVKKTLGIILIALGLFGLAWGGFTYTTRKKVVDIGPIHATREITHNVPLPPIAGALALLAGIVLLVARGKE
jgi:hypothetical protein